MGQKCLGRSCGLFGSMKSVTGHREPEDTSKLITKTEQQDQTFCRAFPKGGRPSRVLSLHRRMQ